MAMRSSEVRSDVGRIIARVKSLKVVRRRCLCGWVRIAVRRRDQVPEKRQERV